MKLTFEEMFGKWDDFEYKERKPLNTLVFGVGINDSTFILEPTNMGKRVAHPAYKTWKNMLERCYSSKLKEKYPTYVGVTCCTEWLSFITFAKWFKSQYKNGLFLDKDLLIKGNKVYSPDTCIFTTCEVNNFIVLCGAARGIQPLGVDLHKGKFRARIRKEGVTKHLGSFSTKEEAHLVWQKAKLEQAIAFNFPPLQRIIDQLTYEIENNLETTSL